MEKQTISRRHFNKTLAIAGSFLLLKPLLDSSVALALPAVEMQFPKTSKVLKAAGFGKSRILEFLTDARLELYPELPDIYKKRKKSITYEEYRKKLGVPQMIQNGPRFLDENGKVLGEIEAKFGVERQALAAIIAIESNYTENGGTLNPVGVFITFIEKMPKRRRFGSRELVELIRFCDKHGFDPFSFCGSYAGAIGHAQFIPSSLNRLFIDFDGDGKPNPMSMADSLASIANYLKAAGWKRGGKIEPVSQNWNAVFAYNHSDYYVRAVKEVTEGIGYAPKT